MSDWREPELDPDALDRWITGDYGERYRALPIDEGLYIDGKPHPGCPECGGVDISDRDARQREAAGGTEEPPWRLVCERCGHEWEEDGS